MIEVLAIVGIVLAMIPATMFVVNLPLFRSPDELPLDGPAEQVSVLIPARDESASIAKSVSAALASKGVEVEVVVLDDHSTDNTADVVHSIANIDTRVRLISGGTLVAGWNGKQHACWQLASAAKYDRLVFLDADVRLGEPALAQLIARQDRTGVDLLSAFPRQQTGTWLEQWIIPMMHFVLLGFLPFARMRTSKHASYAAGCGQLFVTNKAAYERAGTHAAIRSSRHDGLKLPRAFRQAGLSTDVIDGTDLAECRMYTSATEVVRGVLKNAIEGIANPRLIVPFSVLMIGGSVLPVATLMVSMAEKNLIAMSLSIVGVILGHLPRAIAAKVFRQPTAGVVFHSLATLLFVGLQWAALANHLLGRQVAWRGRTESIKQPEKSPQKS